MKSCLLHGDCIELMKQVPDKSVDMILCDLPYLETGNKWDKSFDLAAVCDAYRRLIKDDGCIALTGTFRFGCKLFSLLPDLYKYDWVWEKENGTNVVCANHQPLRIHEQIFIFGKNAVAYTPKGLYMKYNPQKTEGKPYKCVSGRQSENWKGGNVQGFETDNKSGLRHPKTIQKFNRDRDKLHPTQKPVALMEYLIKTYTNEGDLVLDNCMGSGTTGVACKLLNRNFIGIELDENYFNIAKKRIEETNVD